MLVKEAPAPMSTVPVLPNPPLFSKTPVIMFVVPRLAKFPVLTVEGVMLAKLEVWLYVPVVPTENVPEFTTLP